MRSYSLMAQTVKNLPAMQETQAWFLSWEDTLEKEIATHSSILAWTIPWAEEPGRLCPWFHESDMSEQLILPRILLQVLGAMTWIYYFGGYNSTHHKNINIKFVPAVVKYLSCHIKANISSNQCTWDTNKNTHTHIWRLAHSKKLQSTKGLDLLMIYHEEEISCKTQNFKIIKISKGFIIMKRIHCKSSYWSV